MIRTLLLAAALSVATASAFAAQPLAVRDAWSRPSVQGATAVGYLQIANAGPKADALVKVESPDAASVEIHSMSMTGGVMSMKREPQAAVPAGGAATFGPSGPYHLMFITLRRAVKVGDTIPATLTFASGARVPVSFAVRTSAPPAAVGATPGMKP